MLSWRDPEPKSPEKKPRMPVSTNITLEDGFIRVIAAGTMIGLNEAQEYGDRMYAAANKHGVTRILLDERHMVDQEDVMDAYEVSESPTLSRMGMEGFRLALVTCEDNLEINRAWETILQNRAINLKVFTDALEAERWLTS